MSSNDPIPRIRCCCKCLKLTHLWEPRLIQGGKRHYTIAVCTHCIKNIQISRLQEEIHGRVEEFID